jgi:hypothetical protein
MLQDVKEAEDIVRVLLKSATQLIENQSLVGVGWSIFAIDKASNSSHLKAYTVLMLSVIGEILIARNVNKGNPILVTRVIHF